MNFFSRLKIIWNGFWGRFLGSTEARHQGLVNEGLIQEQRRQLHQLKEALTQLIYQRKRLKFKLSELAATRKTVQEDLEQAALDNRDELALHLMEKADALDEEQNFLTQQTTRIDQDIHQARQTESELARLIDKNRHQLTVLTQRKQALSLRRQIHGQLHQASAAAQSENSGLQMIQEQIHRLEAENEVLAKDAEPFADELKELRQQRQNSHQHTRLTQLKSQLNGRLLPAPTRTLLTV